MNDLKIINSKQEEGVGLDQRSKLDLFLYCLVYILFGGVISILGPSIPIWSKEFNLAETDFSACFILRGLGFVTGSILSEKLSQKLNQSFMISAGTLILGLSQLLIHLNQSVIIIIFLYFFTGLSCGLIDVQIHVAIAQFKEEWQVDFGMKAIHFCFSLGAIISPLLVASFSLKTFLFYALSIIALSLFFFIDLFYFKNQRADLKQEEINETQEKVNEIQDSEQNIDENNNFQEMPQEMKYLLSGFLFIYIGIEVSYGGWVSTFGINSIQLNLQQAVLANSFFWISITLGNFLGFLIGKKLTIFQQLQTFTLINIICLSLVIAYSFIYKTTFQILLIQSISMGLGMSLLFPLAMALPNTLKMESNNQTMSFILIFAAISEMVTPPLIGEAIKIIGNQSFFPLFLAQFIFMMIILIQIKKFLPK